jgi:hypothetical protein
LDILYSKNAANMILLGYNSQHRKCLNSVKYNFMHTEDHINLLHVKQ